MWAITRIIMALLKEYKIPTMRILNNLEKSEYRYKNLYRYFINHYIRFKKVNFSKYLGNQVDFLTTNQAKTASLKKGMVEIMVHPDYNNDGQLIDKIGSDEYDYNFISYLS
jgi:hypothetical protein